MQQPEPQSCFSCHLGLTSASYCFLLLKVNALFQPCSSTPSDIPASLPGGRRFASATHSVTHSQVPPQHRSGSWGLLSQLGYFLGISTGLKARRVHEVVADIPTPIKTRAFNEAAAGSFMPLFSCLLHRTVAVVTYTLLSGIGCPVPRAQ